MKKHLTTLLALCCLLGAFAVPTGALEYTFDSPSTGDLPLILQSCIPVQVHKDLSKPCR